ncbi:hypothetical protein ACTVH1_17380 [Gluconobacter cerinus]
MTGRPSARPSDTFDLVTYLKGRPLPAFPLRFIGGSHVPKRPVMTVNGQLEGRPVTLRATIAGGHFSVAGEDSDGLLSQTETERAFPQWAGLVCRNCRPVRETAESLLATIGALAGRYGAGADDVGEKARDDGVKKLADCLGLESPLPQDVAIMKRMLDGSLEAASVQKIATSRAAAISEDNLSFVQAIMDHTRQEQVQDLHEVRGGGFMKP